MENGADLPSVRTAIFVDFDNVYGGLSTMDPGVAEAFATDPGRLLTWLGVGQDYEAPFRRRFLLKACYLNPEVFRKYRTFFVSAGFRVIDCPSLTQRGKSAADIHLALDVVDALDHKTRFDEFIICSADADFSPLMVKLRAHDRRTVMVAAGNAAPAYQALCDETVTPIQIAEAFAKDGRPPSVVEAQAQEAAAAEPALGRASGVEGDPVQSPDVLLTAEEISAATAAVRQTVDAAGGAVRGASAAGAATRVVSRISGLRWGGTGGFAGFVSRGLPDLRLVRTDSDTWLIDPTRRSVEDVRGDSHADDLPSRVSRVTKVPHLGTEQYLALFQELSDLSRQPPSLNRMGAEIRERAALRGAAVPRSAANFVIQGLIYAGADPRTGWRSAQDFGERWRDNVLALCERAGMEIDDVNRAEISAWLLGESPSD